MTPPTARIDMVYDTYFRTTVADPYRWLEDWEGAEARRQPGSGSKNPVRIPDAYWSPPTVLQKNMKPQLWPGTQP